MKLSEINSPQTLVVSAVTPLSPDDSIARRLLELGFISGAKIEVREKAPLLGDPMAVLVRGMIVALRRYEAERVEVTSV